MDISERDEFMCYINPCKKTAGSIDAILQHTVEHHQEKGHDKFSVRKKFFDERVGQHAYKSLHFKISIYDIKQRIIHGQKAHVDEEHLQITFKRPMEKEEEEEEEEEKTYSQSTLTEDSTVYELIQSVLDVMKQIGRLDDFVAVLEAIKQGYLSDNIAFHLLLDVGNFYSLQSVHNMRYNKQSLGFWVTVQKLFKGKGINFFRGFRTQGKKLDSGAIHPSDCEINFAVPSDTVIGKESAKFRMDAANPGILEISLDAFAAQHKGEDVKISIDGKRIATGFGKMGEEDISGFESKPTLHERQDRLSTEIKHLEAIKVAADEHDAGADAETLREACLVSITDLSNRVREVRELETKKKILLRNLMKKVEGDWKVSKLAPAISYLHTKMYLTKTSSSELLCCIDRLGLAVAALNGTDKDYVQGMNVGVELKNQSNYICLRSQKEAESAETTKQKTPEWHSLRDKSNVTGSTIFKAIGLDTLKKQQEHHDSVYAGKVQSISDDLQELFDYGNRNEINALATLLGKVLPVYYPKLKFREDGCVILPLKSAQMVVSGDGCGVKRDSEDIDVAFEFKCPLPGKERVTDQHYRIPIYYTTQVLSEMAAHECKSFAYICFTPESTTLHTGSFDEDLWSDIRTLAEELYGGTESQRPKKKHADANKILDKLHEYVTKCSFVAEFPSLKGVPCDCGPAQTSAECWGHHQSVAVDKPTAVDFKILIDDCISSLKSGYNVLRRPAKEVMVTVLSDLDRMQSRTAHAIPIQYGLSGYSLRMETVRKYLSQAVKSCSERELNVKVIAFDGQFLEITTTDWDGKPLTVLQFMKKYWQDVQSMSRDEKVKSLLSSDGDLVIASPHNISKAITAKTMGKEKSEQITESSVPTLDEGYFIQQVPAEVLSELDEESVAVVMNACQVASQKRSMAQEEAIPTTSSEGDDHIKAKEIDFECALIQLIAYNSIKWNSSSLDEFRSCFSSPETINKRFTVLELKILIGVMNEGTVQRFTSKSLKADLIDIVSNIFGDGSKLKSKIRVMNPNTLKSIAVKAIKNWPISAVNVAYAQKHFSSEFEKWNLGCELKGPAIVKTQSGMKYTINQWYAQPSKLEEHDTCIQMIIDPHHLFVNNRSKCCSSGMPEMGIHPEAWWNVARESKQNGTGLSLEIAKELRDRQSNAFAQTTFSEKVEEQMIENGDTAAANWCSLIRNWYRSVDEAGMSVEDRLQAMVKMREFLLSFLHVGHFPPPGQYVADMTLAQYEGILTNIDRRLQLYKMTATGTYCQRAASSLDSENFFGAFQDFDPKGTGVLRPDDIPIALGSAVYLFSARMDANRKYSMKTSSKNRVYEVHQLVGEKQDISDEESEQLENPEEPNCIIMKAHQFDNAERKSAKPRRKSGLISPFGVPSKGAEGVRSHHKANEEKILPHKRIGLNEEDLLQ